MNVIDEAVHALVAFRRIVGSMEPSQVMAYPLIQVCAVRKS